MTEQHYVYIDANYLKELEEKAKKLDYYKGIIDGMNMVADRNKEWCEYWRCLKMKGEDDE